MTVQQKKKPLLLPLVPYLISQEARGDTAGAAGIHCSGVSAGELIRHAVWQTTTWRGRSKHRIWSSSQRRPKCNCLGIHAKRDLCSFRHIRRGGDSIMLWGHFHSPGTGHFVGVYRKMNGAKWMAIRNKTMTCCRKLETWGSPFSGTATLNKSTELQLNGLDQSLFMAQLKSRPKSDWKGHWCWIQMNGNFFYIKDRWIQMAFLSVLHEAESKRLALVSILLVFIFFQIFIFTCLSLLL